MKKPTQADVAALAGVSRATVSFVVNGKDGQGISISPDTRQRVLESVQELGYVVDARAQSLRSGDTKTIGVYVPIYENPFFWQVLRGISAEAEAAGYKLLLTHGAHVAERERQRVEELAEQRVDGLILMTEFKSLPRRVMAQLRDSSRPIVQISSTASEFDLVQQGYEDGTRALMTHLFELGHRRISFIYGVQDEAQGLDRLHAYREAFAESGHAFDDDWIVRCGPTMEDGHRAATGLLGQPERPTALVVINDLLGMAAIRAAVDLGLRVPTDVSIASFDNIPFADICVPRLTTVAGSPEQNGRDAVRLLLGRLQEPGRPHAVIASEWELIVRESTAAPPSPPSATHAEAPMRSRGGDEMT